MSSVTNNSTVGSRALACFAGTLAVLATTLVVLAIVHAARGDNIADKFKEHLNLLKEKKVGVAITAGILLLPILACIFVPNAKKEEPAARQS